jgi:hypothetical protein
MSFMLEEAGFEGVIDCLAYGLHVIDASHCSLLDDRVHKVSVV